MNCPYLESNYPHCSEHLNMNKLDEAFDLCTNHYMMCPIYLQLCHNEPEPVGASIEEISKN